MSKHEIGCGIIRDLLPPYADGLAGPESRALVEEHLAACEACGNALEQLRSEAAPSPPAPDKALVRVKQKIRRRRVRTGIIAGTAGLAAATALGFFLFAFPLNIRMTEEDISSVRQEAGYNEMDGGRELRFETFRNFGPWRAYEDHRFNEDGSTTVVLVGCFYTTPWRALTHDPQLFREQKPVGLIVMSASFDDASEPGRLTAPEGPIHWELYTASYYDFLKLRRIWMEQGPGNFSLLDENGQLKPKAAKYCKLLWSETTE